MKRRKYDKSYLSLGFIENNNSPQCVVCCKIFPNSSMVPVKLRRHNETAHPDCKEKNISFFERKRDELLKQQKCINFHARTVNEKATEASYIVSYHVARAGEAHVIAETLIKPCLLDVAKCMLDEKSSKLISTVPLSNDTITCRIKDMAVSIRDELISRLKSTNFALQMDESTDVAGLAVLLVLVRYQHEKSLEEDLLICEPLTSNTTGFEIFTVLNNFFIKNQIPWEHCVDICTDGAKAMVGKTSGAVARIKEVAPKCTSSHCILHRQALAVKKMPPSLKTVLDEAVKIINFIKSRPLNMRLFQVLCDDMGSVHKSLLLHTEVRWLSRGKALVRLFELRSEVTLFFTDHTMGGLENKLTDKKWLCRLAYLADIFSKINEVNLGLQGRNMTVFSARDRINAFKKKIQFWVESMKSHTLDCFLTLRQCCEDIFEQKLPDELFEEFVEHLEDMLNSAKIYFPETQEQKLEDYKWVNNPFAVSQKPSCLTAQQYETLIDLISDSALKTSFAEKTLPTFWCTLRGEYPELAQKAISVLLPFTTTYLCETGFSVYVSTKTKYRNRLNAEHDMRLQLSSIQPDIKVLCGNKKQYHPSH